MLGPYGTVVHPSVYFLLDVYTRVAEDPRIRRSVPLIAEFREQVLLESQEIPWFLDTELAQKLAQNEVKAFRIVCRPFPLCLMLRTLDVSQRLLLSFQHCGQACRCNPPTVLRQQPRWWIVDIP